MIRSLPLAVLTLPVYAGVRYRRRYKAPLMGLLKPTVLSSPGVNPWATENDSHCGTTLP